MLKKIFIAILLIFPITANAGFFDDMLDKAKEAASGKIESVTDNGDNKPSSKQASPTAKAPASTASTDKNTGTELPEGVIMPTSAAIDRAVLSYHPEVLDDDRWLKQTVNTLYPEESRAFYNNEFEWNKKKDEMNARVLADIKNPPLTFAIAPWTEKAKGGRLALGKYDFNRKAFAVRGSFLELSLGRYDSRKQIMKLGLSDIRWVPMDQEKAEQLVNSTDFTSHGRVLYPQFTYTISDVKSFSKQGKISLAPTVEVSDIRLYQYTNKEKYVDNGADDYKYVTTISLDGK